MSSTVETRDEALCVRVLWGERRLATHLVRAAPLSVGEGPSPLRFDGLEGFGVAFADGVSGEVLRNGETPLLLGEAVHRGLAVETPHGWRLPVGRRDVVRLRRGPLLVEALRVRAPPRASSTLDDRVDYRFLNTLLVCFAVSFGLLAQASFDEDAFEDDGLTARQAATLRRVLVKPAQPPPPQRAEATPEKEPVAVKSPRKTPPAEGRPKPLHTPRKDTGGLTAAAFGQHVFGPGTLGVLGPGGLGAELDGALGRVTAATGDGLGGWSLRGSGSGGAGGERIGLGGIPTSGVAKRGGIGRLCGGPGPCKASVAPTIEVSDPIDCGGPDARACMDKELIRKVIASHRDQLRYCYELALQSAPALAGKVALAFSVASSGDVAAAAVQSTTVGSPSLESCLVSRVRTWHFPVPPRSPGYRVTYPFLFKPPQP